MKERRKRLMDKLTFFDTEKDLRELTGIDTHEGLREAGFYLDDWDWGFVSDNPYTVVCQDDYGYDYDEVRSKHDGKLLCRFSAYRIQRKTLLFTLS